MLLLASTQGICERSKALGWCFKRRFDVWQSWEEKFQIDQDLPPAGALLGDALRRTLSDGKIELEISGE